MKPNNSLSSPSRTASNTARRDGQTAGGHSTSGLFLPKGEPGGARLPLAIERAANFPHHQRIDGDMYQDPDIDEIEAETAPWWLALVFAVMALVATYWILKAAIYFGGRLIGMAGPNL